MNCEDAPEENHGVRYGEESRASTPRRARDIPMCPVEARVARPLFHIADLTGSSIDPSTSKLHQGTSRSGSAHFEPGQRKNLMGE
jgi:hypothetical protein